MTSSSRKRDWDVLGETSYSNVRRLNASHDTSSLRSTQQHNTSSSSSSSSSAAVGGGITPTTAAFDEFKRSKDDERQLKAAEVAINAHLEADERRGYVLDNLVSSDNGHYYFPQQTRFKKSGAVSFPQAIMDQYDYMEVYTFSGIFAEINRAWITIDNKLFLWNYHDGVQFATFDQLSQIIISAALIQPRAGTFPPQVRYVIVLATPVEVVMLQCLFENEEVYGDLELVPSKYTVATDNVHMTKIVGTKDNSGRVFMCGKDGNLYELVYYAEASWFSNDMTFKCKKVNHTLGVLRSVLPTFLFSSSSVDPIVDVAVDEQRGFMYTLSKRNHINVFELGADGQSLRHLSTCANVFSLCQQTLQLYSMSRADWNAKQFKIQAIFPLSTAEAAKTLLVAITNHGHRVYFHFARSQQLGVKFIRLCPPMINRQQYHDQHHYVQQYQQYQQQQQPQHLLMDDGPPKPLQPAYKEGQSPKNVRRVYYHSGVLLLVDSAPDTDSLVMLNPDSLPPDQIVTASDYNTRVHLNEAVECDQWPQHVFDLAEMPPTFYMSFTAASLFASNEDTPLAGLSEFATQHALPQRRFLCLTRSGLLTFMRLRPVDELRALLRDRSRANNASEIQAFFERYGNKEACAMCLILACGTNTYTEQLSERVSMHQLQQQQHQQLHQQQQQQQQQHHISMNDSARRAISFNDDHGDDGDGGDGGGGGSSLSFELSSVIAPGSSSMVGRNANRYITGVGEDVDEEIERQATAVFFEYGRPAFYTNSSSSASSSSSVNDRGSSNSISGGGGGSAFYGGSLSSQQQSASSAYNNNTSMTNGGSGGGGGGGSNSFRDMGQAVMAPIVNFSGKHDGLHVYLARLLRPVWVWSITVAWDVPPYQQLRFPKEQLLDLKAPLDRLHDFVDKNRELLFNERIDTRHVSTRASNAEEQHRLMEQRLRMQQVEVQSLQHLKFTLDMCIEAFSLLLILSEKDFLPLIVERLSIADRSRLATLKFWHLVTDESGQRMARVLIEAMKDCPDEDQWVVRLYQQCPHFFGEADLLHYRALENLRAYRDRFDRRQDRDQYIQHALNNYRQAARSRNFPLLQVCRNLRQVHYYPGVIELCLYRAELLRNGDVPSVSHDEHELALVQSHVRMCYDCILQTLDSVICSVYPEDEEPAPESLYLDPSERKTLQRQALEEALRSDDVQFHYRLYMWMMKRKLMDELYRLQSPHIIPFLLSDEQYIPVLVDYYLANNMYIEVAILLHKLANREGDVYTLSERINFLSRALACAQNAAADPSTATVVSSETVTNLIFEVRERITSSKVQLRMFNTLEVLIRNRLRRADIDALYRAVDTLNKHLYDYDELMRMAVDLKLWEICLAIATTTEDSTHDFSQIRQLYSNILTQEINMCHERGTDWRPSIGAKVKSLADSYLKNDGGHAFPVDLIVTMLEQFHHHYGVRSGAGVVGGQDEEFVVNTMLEAGVNGDKLVSVYDMLIESSNDKPDEAKVLLCASVFYLIKRLTTGQQEQQQQQQPHGRRRYNGGGGGGGGGDPLIHARIELMNKVVTLLNSMADVPSAKMLQVRARKLYETLMQPYQNRGNIWG